MPTGPPATQSGESRRIVRFASFEFDPGTGELRKHGMRLKLQGQPIGVLAMLIERPGEIVSRDDLQKRLWPADTHVDFEHSLNAAIKRLRAALGDSADSPRFVETMPRQGYRFIAPIQLVVSGMPVDVSEAKPVIDNLSVSAEVTGKTGGRRVFSLLAVTAVLALGVAVLVQSSDYLWQNPIAGARFQTVTDLEGAVQASISRDGKFVAFLSDHEGQMDVWVTQVGSGRYHNLTRGSVTDIVNESIRNPGFSPDGAFVTFWTRRADGSDTGHIGIWAVPTLGGEPRPYLDGVAEFDWSRDGSRLAYHTPSTGDPLFVSDGSMKAGARPILIAPAGEHSHFPLWAPDGAWLYFVQGTLPDKLDIWRMRPTGGEPERITWHNGRVSYPVLLDKRTLLYLATDADGSGPWLYSVNVDRRIPHRLSTGVERYTSLAATADGRRVVATLASPKKTLWRLPMTDSPAGVPPAAKISLTTSAGFSPRLGPDFLLYVSETGAGESIWKLAKGNGTELWSGQGARIFGGTAISPDGKQIAFSVRQHGRSLIYVMQTDGTNAQVLTDSLDLQGSPTWTPDGRSIVSAANDHGVPRLFRIPLQGRSPALFVKEYALDPVCAPSGRFVVYSGPDIGTNYPLKAVTASGSAYPLPALMLSRGARHLTFVGDGRELAFLRGEMQHKNLWVVDLQSGVERQLTHVPPDFEIRDYDISPDGREMVLERVQEQSDVVLLDLANKPD